MNVDDALAPWSAPRILRHLDGDSERRMELLALASRLPDVASRTLLCPLFSHRSLQQLAHSPVLDTLSSMCKHALAQQRRYEEAGSDMCVITEGDGRCVTAPAAEVTYAATLTSSLFEDMIPNLGAALLPLIGGSRGSILTVLKERLSKTSHYSSGDMVNKKSILSTTTRKTLTLLPTKRAAKCLQEENGFLRESNLPPSMSSEMNVARAVCCEDRCELLRTLGDAPLPFRVHSRDDVMVQQANQKILETNMTVVLQERVVPLPPWKRRRMTDSEDVTEREDSTDPPPPVSTAPPRDAHQHMVNATWVTEGELVLVNGRLVHREIKEPLEKGGKKRTDNVKNQKGTNSAIKMVTSPETNMKNSSSDSGLKKISTEGCSTSNSTARIGSAITRNVPLNSREELLLLVDTLQISDVLRDAFLIGLGDAESKVEKEDL